MRFSTSMLKLLSLVLVIAAFGAQIARAEDTAAPAAAQAAATAEPAKKKVPEPSGDLLKFIDGDHLIGDAKAPVQIIEYASLSCSHCAHFSTEVFPLIEEKYIKTGKVKFIFRHFPLNEPALRGAILAECVGEEKFWTYLKVMFKSQEKWAYGADYLQQLHTLANVGGLGSEKFDACLKDKSIEERIVVGVTWANERLKVQSTPTFFLNNEMLQGSQTAEKLSAMIDKELKAAGAE